jgi:hypothetical protein
LAPLRTLQRQFDKHTQASVMMCTGVSVTHAILRAMQRLRALLSQPLLHCDNRSALTESRLLQAT